MIQKEIVKRDTLGFWSHSVMSQFGENCTQTQISKFKMKNNCDILITFMEDSADPKVVEQSEKGEGSCSLWNPAPPKKNAFLLSIHDTEDGVQAWWCVPNYDL